MKVFFVSILLLFLSFNSFSQQYNFINYSVEHGLIQSQINTLCQDDKGYIWIGTLGGVSKFDGINFKNYSTKDGLINNQINNIFKDKSGNLWFGSLGGISMFNGSQFENFHFKTELRTFFVTSIKQDNNGALWLATDGGGIIKYYQKKFEYFLLSETITSDQNYVRHIFCDQKNNKWLSTKKGVFLMDTNNIIKDTITNVNASQVYIDSIGTVWCATYGDGVLKINSTNVRKITVETDGLISNHIRSFKAKKDGSIWFVSKSGVSKWYKNRPTNFAEKDGLKSYNIKCIIEDDEGNMFMGSDGGGLIKFTNDKFISYTQNDGLISNTIMSIVEDKDGAIWFSSYGNGVSRLYNKVYTNYTEQEGLGNNTVWCSLVDKQNHVWFGTSTGFSVFDGKKITSYNSKHGLNANKVYALTQDEQENIWIGSKEGLSVLYLNRDSLYNFTAEFKLPTNIRTIVIENESIIWLCSAEGLIKFNPTNKTHVKYTIENGLPDNSVMSLVKDKNNTIWVGTKNGLAYFTDKKFVPVLIAEDYSSNTINFLKLDKFNSLWIGTNNGLYHLKQLDVENITISSFIRYSNLDGLKSLECNQNAVFIDSKNNLWFGTNLGLTKHSIQPKNEVLQIPKINLKEIRLFFEQQDWKKYTKDFDENQLPKNLVLPYNKNHLTFDFDGIYHKSPDKIRFRFRLIGFDEDWQPITKATFVTYSNIPFGEYTFELAGSVDMKNWSNPVKFNVTINPPFWFRWWFYILVVLFLAGITWLIIELRIKGIHRKQATQLIVDQAKMLSLEQQALNASLNRHFIFNALNSIQYYINREDKLSANKYLTSFAKLVRKNLDSTLENEIELDDEIERIELYLKLEQMRFQDKFDFNIDIDESLRFSSVKIPSMLLQPYIENSIWHGILPTQKHGEILVKIYKEDGNLIITIKDNGVGIETSLKEKQDKQQLHVSKGMDLTKSRINLINRITNKSCYVKGPYQIYDAAKNVAGTEVSITIKLGD
jgi:ligand-binding sensor domain-containing protein